MNAAANYLSSSLFHNNLDKKVTAIGILSRCKYFMLVIVKVTIS
jgi:hypothetical protein